MSTEVTPFFPQQARELIYEHVKRRLVVTDLHISFDFSDVYVVTFAFVRNDWKALVSTTLPDGMYYEVTRNSFQKETYIDSYKKWEHVVVQDTD